MHQVLQPFRPNARCRNLRLHITNYQVRDTNVVAQELPHWLDLTAALIDLDGLEL